MSFFLLPFSFLFNFLSSFVLRKVRGTVDFSVLAIQAWLLFPDSPYYSASHLDPKEAKPPNVPTLRNVMPSNVPSISSPSFFLKPHICKRNLAWIPRIMHVFGVRQVPASSFQLIQLQFNIASLHSPFVQNLGISQPIASLGAVDRLTAPACSVPDFNSRAVPS